MAASHKSITAAEVRAAVEKAYEKLRGTTGGRHAD